jgi:5-methylcytosine-specific restriction protein A
MTKRKPLTRLQRVKLFDDHKGTCCLCHTKINAHLGDKWIVEHVKPLWLGGDDDERNMGPAHEKCGREKTSAEAPVKAKSDRVRANHLGVKKPRTITRWRKFDGTIVVADRER